MALFHHESVLACNLQFFLFISPHLAVVSCIHLCSHHCAALQGGLFCPIIRTHNTQMSQSPKIAWEKNKAWLLWAKVWTIQVNSLPSSHFFAQFLEMVIGKNPNLSAVTQYNFVASQPTLHWLWNKEMSLGCLPNPLPWTEVVSLPHPQPSACAATGTTLRTALGANLRVPRTQLQRTHHPNSPL